MVTVFIINLWKRKVYSYCVVMSDEEYIYGIFFNISAYYDVEVKKLISTGIGEESDFFV